MEPTLILVKRKKSPIKAIFITILSIFIVFNIIGLIAGNYFYNVAVHKVHNQGENYYAREVSNASFDYQKDEKLSREDITIHSSFGYDLKGTYIKNTVPTENTVILVHGIGGDRWTMMSYGDLYLDKGFNILVYDTRNHALSGGKDVSYGYYEKDDLDSVVQYVKKQHPNGIIGIEGVSMGASSVVLYADKYAANNDVSFYVADCPYSDLNSLFTVRLHDDYHIPNLLLIQYASFVSKIRSGFFLGQVSPLNGIDKVKTPMLFIHGKSDTYVPTQMGIDLYNKKGGNKQLLLVNNAAHAKSITTDRQGYKDALYTFIDEAMKK